GVNKSPATTQWYVDQTPGRSGPVNDIILPDWVNNTLTFMNGDGGLTQFSMVNGSLLRYVAATDIFSNGHTLANEDGCVGADGNFYFTTNSFTIAKIDPSTLTLIAESGTFFGSDAIVSLAPAITPAGTPALFCGVDTFTGPGDIAVIDCATLLQIGATFATTSDGNSCNVFGSANSSTGWAVGAGQASPPSSLIIYKMIIQSDT